MIDPVTTQVIANRLLGISEEMGVTLIRASYSPNVKERGDCSTAVFNSRGQVIAQAQRVPMHLGSMLGAVQGLIGRAVDPGDMFLVNDPYSGGGQHLPDLNVVAPVFRDGRLVGFVANIAHHADVGGMLPGSEAASCRTIFQEGLRIPPVRIIRGGELSQDILDIVLLNTRTPRERLGDLRAQFAANKVGIDGYLAVCDKYGVELVAEAVDEYLAYTARRFRNAIAHLPEGTYSAEDWLDQDEEGSAPVPLRLVLTMRGAKLRFDFSGTGPQLVTSRNVPLGALHATVYTVCKNLLDPDLPPNSGYYDSIEIVAPPGSLVNPLPPAAVGVRALTCAVVGDTVAAALSSAIPDKALAGCGPHHQILIAGRAAENGDFYVDYETFAGASGARPYHDGTDAVRIHASGSSNLPVESLEHAYPVRVECYELRADSGGAGRFRGGMGVRRDYRVLAPATISVSAERQRVAPRGLEGGHDGATGEFHVNGTLLPSAAAEHPLQTGDVVTILTPGGGGHGSPLQRDREAVVRDVREDRVSLERARMHYGWSTDAEK